MARACAAQTNATFLKLAGPQLVQVIFHPLYFKMYVILNGKKYFITYVLLCILVAFIIFFFQFYPPLFPYLFLSSFNSLFFFIYIYEVYKRYIV